MRSIALASGLALAVIAAPLAQTKGGVTTVPGVRVGHHTADITTIGALAADVMAEAILRGVRETTGLPNYPAVRDLIRK